jgi:hypothetical protein
VGCNANKGRRKDYNAIYGLFGFAIFFSHHKRPDLQKMCFFLQYLSETFLILRIIRRDITIHAHRSSCTVSVTLLRFFNENRIFWTDFRNMRCDNLIPGIVAACRWGVESGKLVYSCTFGHVPSCVCMNHRQNE